MNLQPFPQFLHPETNDHRRTESISAKIPGWSGAYHYGFFRMLMQSVEINKILVLGVYHGRDLAFIEDIASRFFPERKLDLVGVDLFSPGPCADWSEEMKTKTWQELGFGPNPDAEASRENCPNSEIVVGNSVEYLKTCGRVFDLIYFDTSHDENTINDELKACVPCCHAHTILAGDDYNDVPNWGVKKVVCRSFKTHNVYPPIWLSTRELLKI